MLHIEPIDKTKAHLAIPTDRYTFGNLFSSPFINFDCICFKTSVELSMIITPHYKKALKLFFSPSSLVAPFTPKRVALT